MTQNPYAAADTDRVEPGGDIQRAARHLDLLSRITMGVCFLWFGMMVLGRLNDDNAPPLRAMVGFYAALGFAPAFGLFGAWSTLNRKHYGLCLFGAVCIALPLVGPCCGLTMPIGIWALLLLLRPEIKESFHPWFDSQSYDPESADDVLARAARLDSAGEWEQAIAVYGGAAERWPEQKPYIEKCMARIRLKQSYGKSNE